MLCIETSVCVNPGWLGRALIERDLPLLYLLSLTIPVSLPFCRTDIFVFLLSTRAGGLGINLTAADTVRPSAHCD